jgi:acetyl-CoA carboxylase biotin carboxylase subunit
MRRALDMFIIEGVKTTIPLHRKIFANAQFQAGRIDTHFLESSGLTPPPNVK